ncbi:hypothetical protein LINGRAHAP2_LOCUS24954 [Linum grandiflorum]
MLKFPGTVDVERILTLGRWNFKGRNIEADRWLPFSSRSSVAARQGVMWLRMDGVPLHIRSTALFRQLGNVCGSFLESRVEGCSMNAVRIKVGQIGVIPSQITVLVEEEQFLIRVIIEDDQNVIEGWKGRGLEFFVRVRDKAARPPEINRRRSVERKEEIQMLGGNEDGHVGESEGNKVSVKSRTVEGTRNESADTRADSDKELEVESQRAGLEESDISKEKAFKLTDAIYPMTHQIAVTFSSSPNLDDYKCHYSLRHAFDTYLL